MPKAVQFSRGSIIYFSGETDDKVFILQQGVVILTSVDIETGLTVTEQVKPGEFFGVKSSLGHFPREETATTITDSIVVSMNVQEFEKVFSSNQQVILKMLKVFSGQLRQIHKKTESVLNKDPIEINPLMGMFNVAKSFYEDEQFRSCADVCLKILTRFPNASNKEEIARFYADAKLQDERKKKMAHGDDVSVQPDMGNGGALSQFSLPAFKRFAKKYEPGQVIISEFEPGDCFYLIQAGQVQLVKCVNGSTKNLDILKPGEFFGEMAILDNSPRSATCMAAGNVECLEFNKENFQLLITGNPQIALVLLKLFCKRIYDQKRRFRVLAIKDIQAKIADVFVMQDEMNPVSNLVEKSRKFYITASDVAHWAGISTDEAREELMKFAEKRKIEIHENYIVVTNIMEMKRLVDNHSTSRF